MNVLLDRGPDLDDEFWDGLEETLILADIGAPAASDDRGEPARPGHAQGAARRLRRARPAERPDSRHVHRGRPRTSWTAGRPWCCSWASTARARPPRWARSPRRPTDAGRTVHPGQRRHVPRRRHRAAGGVGAARGRGGGHARARQRPGQRVLRHPRACRGGGRRPRAHRHGRAPAHVGRPHARAGEGGGRGAQARATCPCTRCWSSTPPPARTAFQQAREFDRALDLDGVIVTKLDGTAKGGIALAVSHELELPVLKIGVGEGLDDLRDFDPHDFARALVGEFDERE